MSNFKITNARRRTAAGRTIVAGPVAFTGTHLLNNSAGIAGGGAAALSTTVIVDSQFENNRCVQTGCSGASVLAGADFTAARATFRGNHSLSHGGAVWVNLLFRASIDQSLFENNYCTEITCAGGGLYANSSAILTDTFLVSNAAALAGGGAIVGASLTVNGGSFEGNRCIAPGCTGGGLAAASSLALTNTRFISNSAAGSGGGLVTYLWRWAVGKCSVCRKHCSR